MASSTLTVMAGSIVAPVLNLMREGLDVDPTYVGLIITTHGLFIALFSPVMGNLIDRVGPKWPFATGLVLYGLAGGSGLLIHSFWLLLVSRAILGIALAAFYNAITVLILNLYEGAERNRVMGWRGSTNSLGGIIWPLIGGFLGQFSWHHPFAVYIVGLPFGLLAFMTIPKIRTESKAIKTKEKTVLSVFREKPKLLAIYGFMCLSNLLLYSIVIFLPQRLEKLAITDPFYIGLFFSAMVFSSGVISFNYGWVKSKLSYQGILVLALALWTIGFTLVSQTSMVPLILTAIALFGIGMGMVMPTIPLWIGDTVPVSFRGRFSSYIGTSGFMGQFLSPILFAPVLILFGLTGIFLLVAGVCGVLFIITLLIYRRSSLVRLNLSKIKG